MALIKCKECSKEFSSDAKVCPHCGSTKNRSFFSKHPIISTVIGLLVFSTFLQALSGNGGRNLQGETNKSEDKPQVEKKSDSEIRREAIKNVEIKDFNWHLSGSVLILENVKILNKNNFAIKDLTLLCITGGNSGTILSQPEKDIFEVINPNKTLNIDNINFGFVNSQSSQIKCSVISLKFVENYL